jgi:hypothetical protein
VVPYPAHGFVDLDYTRSDMPAAFRRFAAEAGITVIDTTEAFRAHRRLGLFLAEDYHASPSGHRVIARQVARFLATATFCRSAAL